MQTEVLPLAQQIYTILNAKKLTSLEVLDVHELTTLSNLFVIATAANVRQTKALADELEQKLAQQNIYAYQKEGYQSANWILLDFDDIIVHILVEEDALFYGLDRLWKDGTHLTFDDCNIG